MIVEATLLISCVTLLLLLYLSRKIQLQNRRFFKLHREHDKRTTIASSELADIKASVGGITESIKDLRLYFSVLVKHSPNQNSDERKKHSSNKAIAQRLREGESLTIVVAGMRHSGSTALFNLIRLLLKDYPNVICGYADSSTFSSLEETLGSTRLIKIHEYRDDVAAAADFIITTRRDLRETVASAIRRDFSLYKSLGGSTAYARYNRGLHNQWINESDYEFVFESYKTDGAAEVRRVTQALGFFDADIGVLSESLINLPLDNYEATLLTPNHITNPDGKLSYQDILTTREIADIQIHNFIWLARYNYRI